MTGTLRLQDDGWELESEGGEVVDKGGYPLRENLDFIQSASEVLDNLEYHHRPYVRIDDRSIDKNGG